MRPRLESSSLRDVARKAGVSLATVSYVLNGGPRQVGEETRARVLAALRETGYERRPRGRTRSRPLTVGIVVPDATKRFFSRAIGAAQRALAQHGHAVITASSLEDPQREAGLLATLFRLPLSGLLLTPVDVIPPEVAARSERGLPVVLMDRETSSPSISSVAMDNRDSAFNAVRLLIDSGHRRIALVNGPESAVTAQDRLRGYREALAQAGLSGTEMVCSGPFLVEEGRRATLELLAHADPPDAIFSASVFLTSGVLRALQERRLRWPDDIAVIGFGDPNGESVVVPPLTVIEQPAEQLGELAVQLFHAAVSGRRAAQHVILESRLVIRESHWLVPAMPPGGDAQP